MSRRQFWSEATSFDEEVTDVRMHPNYAAATDQLTALRSEINLLVEIGSGSGTYLRYLRGHLNLPVIGSDIASPRLENARRSHPNIKFHTADASEIVRKFTRPGVAFLAMHVLGNLTGPELSDFFGRFHVPGTSITFCAAGLPIDRQGETQPHEDGGFRHNFVDALRGSRLNVWSAFIRQPPGGRTTYIITAVVPGLAA